MPENTPDENKARLPLAGKILFALGQFGWSLVSYAPANLLVYFFMPPETGERQFPVYVHQGAVLGLFTVLGLALATGRLFDAVTDPLVAGLSDRSSAKIGKRKSFLLISVLPFALLSSLVFFPPSAGESAANTVWVFVGLLLYYWFLTMYVTPYFALVTELGRDSKDRLLLSTLISVTWALGFALGSQVFSFKEIFEGLGMSSLDSFRTVVLCFSGLGFVLMLVPILFVDENKYGSFEISREKIFSSLKDIFRNRNFRLFVLSDLCYWLALSVVTLGLVYYVTIFLGLNESFSSTLQRLMFVLSFLFYLPTNLAAQKFGKKAVLILGFLFFMIVYLLLLFLGKLPFGPEIQGYAVAIVLALPLAIFGILPNAVVADLSEAESKKKGTHRAAMYFGARTFVQKIGQVLGGLLFPSLLLLGGNAQNDAGLRLSALVALVFLGIGLLLFSRFKESGEN